MASVRVVAALLLVMLAVARGEDTAPQVQAPVLCPDLKCSGGLEPILDPRDPSKCNFQCCSPKKPFCLPPLDKAYCCGGTTGVRCLAIACTKAYAYATAGPGGCASAAATISASANSDADYQTAFPLDSYTNVELCTGNPVDTTSRWVNAIAKATATTLLQYYTYACACCWGHSDAYAGVKGSVQAVAAATAKAAQNALRLAKCKGEVVGGASAQLDAAAADIQLAIDSVMADVAAKKGFGTNPECDVKVLFYRVQKQVAEALACTFYKFFFTFYNDEADVKTCDKVVAIADPQNVPAIWKADCKTECVPTSAP